MMRETQLREIEVPSRMLSNGTWMPQIGFGVFELKDYVLCRQCVRDAIGEGYRLFDTAAAYDNEEAVGDAVREAIDRGIVRREDIFLTTKVWLQDYGAQETVRAVAESMRKLKVDYLDLVLLHQPFGKWPEAWQELEKLQRKGWIRAIGVSNFTPAKMKQLFSLSENRPQVNQIEIHPFYTQKAYTRKLRDNGIAAEAWGPLCEGQKGIFAHPVLAQIGAAHDKSPAQIALRWNLQSGNIIIPKSTKKNHREENLDILDFSLSPEEMSRVESLDLGHSEIIDFNSPATERLLMKWKIHGDGPAE